MSSHAGLTVLPCLMAPSHPQRPEVEGLIRGTYRRAYGALLDRLPETLFVLRDAGGAILAACGLRNAAPQPLFLEAYLDAPVEQLLAARTARAVQRAGITEVCNLATSRSGHARLLIDRLTQHLHQTAQDWVVFTATLQLRNAFTRLGLKPLALGPADPARLGAERWRWGSYYQATPMVMAGDVAGGYRALQRQHAPRDDRSGWRLPA